MTKSINAPALMVSIMLAVGCRAGDESKRRGDDDRVPGDGSFEWPPPFVANATLTVSVDTGLTGAAGTCSFSCLPNPRDELSPVMDLCELGGATSAAAGFCSGGSGCPPEQECVVDEFEFMVEYCALDGLPQDYCGASLRPAGYVAAVNRITHRLVGAQLQLRLLAAAPTPQVQASLWEGWDEIDDQGLPWPLPLIIEATSGTVVLSSDSFASGATLSATYDLQFESPDVPAVSRDIRGQFTLVVH